MRLSANNLNIIENNIQQGNEDSLKNNKDLQALLNTGINIYRDESGCVDFDSTKNLLKDEELNFFLNQEIGVYSLNDLAGDRVSYDNEKPSTKIWYFIDSEKDISNYSVNSFAHIVSQHPVIGFHCKDIEFVVDLTVAGDAKYTLPYPDSGVSWSSSYKNIILKIGELNLSVTSTTCIPNLNYEPITIKGVTYYALSTLTLHFACSNKDLIFNKGFINENVRIVFPGTGSSYTWGRMPYTIFPQHYRLIISNFNTNLIDSSEINPLKYYIDSAMLSEKETPPYERNYELWRHDQYCSTPVFPNHIEHFVEEHSNNVDRLIAENNIYTTNTNIFKIRDSTGQIPTSSSTTQKWQPTISVMEAVQKETVENSNILYKSQVNNLLQYSQKVLSQNEICPKNIDNVLGSLINYCRDNDGSVIFDMSKKVSEEDKKFHIIIPFIDIYPDYVSNIINEVFKKAVIAYDESNEQYFMRMPFENYNNMFENSPPWIENNKIYASNKFSNQPWTSVKNCLSGVSDRAGQYLDCCLYYAYPYNEVPVFEEGKTLEELREKYKFNLGNDKNDNDYMGPKSFYSFINYYLTMLIGSSSPDFSVEDFDISAVLTDKLYMGDKKFSFGQYMGINSSTSILNHTITVNGQQYAAEPELANCGDYGEGYTRMPVLKMTLDKNENMVDFFSNKIFFKPNSKMQTGSIRNTEVVPYVKAKSEEELQQCKKDLEDWATKLLTNLHLVIEFSELEFSYYNPKKIIDIESEGEQQ